MTIPRILPLLLAIAALSGCASTANKPKPVASSAPWEAAQSAIPDKPVDVWLMPLEGFPPEYARELEKRFSAELGLNVRSTVHAGRTPNMFGPSGQMLGERVRDQLRVRWTPSVGQRIEEDKLS